MPLLTNANNETINPMDVSNQFNKYFSKLGKLFNNILPTTSTPDRHFADFECPTNTLSYFKEVSAIEV